MHAVKAICLLLGILNTSFTRASESQNSSVSISSNSTSNSSSLSAVKTFRRIKLGYYWATGTYDTDKTLPNYYPVARVLRIDVDSMLARKPPSLRVTKGRQISFYTDVNGAVRVRINWVMDGGDVLTYGECRQVFQKLKDAVDTRPSIDDHAVDILISRAGSDKILFNVDREVGEQQVHVTPPQAQIQFVGYIWPARRLPTETLLANIDMLIREVQQQHPAALIPNFWSKKVILRGIAIDVHCQGSVARAFPAVRWGWLLAALNDLKELYRQGGSGAEFYGQMYVSTQLAGYLTVRDDSGGIEGPAASFDTPDSANGTVHTIGAS